MLLGRAEAAELVVDGVDGKVVRGDVRPDVLATPVPDRPENVCAIGSVEGAAMCESLLRCCGAAVDAFFGNSDAESVVVHRPASGPFR